MAANGDDLKAATGIAGLDDVLRGGFPRNRVYLIQGDPGSGKTTLGLQFLLEGRRRGETGMYITPFRDARRDRRRRAIPTAGRSTASTCSRCTAVEPQLAEEAENTLFEPVRGRAARDRCSGSLREIERSKRQPGGARFAVRDAPAGAEPAALPPPDPGAQAVLRRPRSAPCCSSTTAPPPDDDRQLQSLAHGVISLEQPPLDYGNDRRRLRVVKLRGVAARAAAITS